jgi:hypothetical protein
MSPESIMKLYQKPSEFVIWEISNATRDLRKKAKGKVKEEKPSEKKAASTNNDPSRNVLKMSLANTGLLRKNRMKKQPKGKFVDPRVGTNKLDWMRSEILEVNSKLQEPFENFVWQRRSSNPTFSAQNYDNRRRPESASPVLSRQGSAIPKGLDSESGSPHPHHFNHPETHVDPILIKNGAIRSRTSSMTNLFETIRPKTPPSPHHHTHPLKTLSKNVTPTSASGKEKTAVPKSGKGETRSGNFRKTRWTADPDWENLLKFETARRENDNPIESAQEKALSERKKGDALHTPLGKVGVDFATLFFGAQSASFKINRAVESISSCVLSINLESPLLSPPYLDWLKPMMLTIERVTNMPSRPIPYHVLEELCEPLNIRFRFFDDSYIHSVQLDSTRMRDVDVHSQHVILLGLMNDSKLNDQLSNQKLRIEVHDRDYKYRHPGSAVASEFYDTGIIQTNLNPVSPYGIAQFGFL